MRNLSMTTMIALTIVHMALPSRAAADGHRTKDNKTQRSEISVSVTVQQRVVEQRLRVLASFEFKNASQAEQRLERSLALPTSDCYNVPLRVFDKSGDAVRYVGPHIHRLPPKPEDFLVFRPGQSRLVSDVDVTDCYDWPREAQKLTIKVELYYSGRQALQLLESNPVEFDYQPVVARPGVSREKLMKKRKGARPAQLPESSPRPQ
jgi:hypothetical protein